MNAQAAIEKVLQDFTKELLKVFSQAVVHAVSQVGDAGHAAILATSSGPVVVAKRTRGPGRPKAAPTGAGPAKAAKRAGKVGRGGVIKSTPDQVNELRDQVLDLLRKSSRNLAAREIMKALELRITEEGRFQYALNRLKDENLVQQHGERRQARYGVGSGEKPAAKPRVKGARGPGRPRKEPAAVTETAEEVSVTPETETAVENVEG